MTHLRKQFTILSATAAGFVVATAAAGARLDAQITVVSRTQMADAAQLTFGYLCDDRFVVRNDGTKPVDLEYGVEKGTEHTKLSLNARESVELASKSRDPVELWMDGKMVARAKKENRSCKGMPGNAAVTVAPLEVPGSTPGGVAYAYPPPYPYYDPWGFGFYDPMEFGPYFPRFGGYPMFIGGHFGGHRGR